MKTVSPTQPATARRGAAGSALAGLFAAFLAAAAACSGSGSETGSRAADRTAADAGAAPATGAGNAAGGGTHASADAAAGAPGIEAADGSGEALGDFPGGDGDAAWPNPIARTSLVSELPFLMPGQEQYLGILFEVSDGWHLYWKGRNDTGMYPRVRLTGPEGVTIGEIRWPAPERKVSPGNILDHIYHGTVVLPVPVTIPAAVEPGTFIEFTASVEWMACREACVPESARVALALPVATEVGSAWEKMLTARAAGSKLPFPDSGEQNRVGSAFAAARPRLPEPLPGGAAGMRRSWAGSTLTLSFEEAGEVFFYPTEACPPLADPIADAAAQGNTLTLRFRGDPGAIERVSGVLEVRPAGKAGIPPRLYSVSFPGPGRG